MDLLKTIKDIGIVPLVALEDAADALPLAKALIKGNIPVLEITFRSKAAQESMCILSEQCPELLLGAGTVHNVEQAQAALKAGAKFIVTPGMIPRVVEWCTENGLAILPGVSSPTDIETALSMGLTSCKFFPAEVYGGVSALKAFKGPFGQVNFLPTGGIHKENMVQYLALSNVLAVGGSFVLSDDALRKKDWEQIASLCHETYAKMFNLRLAHIGMNTKDKEDSQSLADALSSLLDAPKSGSMCEIIKGSHSGENGHIALLTDEIERAAAYFERKGFPMNPDTYQNDEIGKLKSVYFGRQPGGFSIHLIRR